MKNIFSLDESNVSAIREVLDAEEHRLSRVVKECAARQRDQPGMKDAETQRQRYAWLSKVFGDAEAVVIYKRG